MNWIKVPKSQKHAAYPFFTVRKMGIGISADLARRHEIKPGMFAEVFCQPNQGLYGFKFMDVATPDCYIVTPDGGGRGGSYKQSALWIACGKIVTTNADLLAEASHKERRKIPALFDQNAKVVYFQLTPAFAYKVSARKPQAEECGVYRYVMDGEVVYIGQGALSERIGHSQRKDWVFDDIEYMIVESEAERLKIESGLIDEHRQSFGRLPFYNRIAGRKNE